MAEMGAESYRGTGDARRRPGPRSWAWRGALGALLVAASWALSWGLPGPRTHVLFFPLWLGYVLAVDALVERRTGSSLLRRSPADFALLFLASVPAWWLFEILNRRLENWVYLGGEGLGDLENFLLGSLCYSTVLPAVFETAELLRSFRWTERFAAGPRLPAGGRALPAYFAAGAAMLAALLAWPRVFYPLTWLSLIFLLEPLCRWLKRPSLLSHLGRGDWRPAAGLAAGALVCGFFWELWNFYSYPKWVYQTPGADFGHIFEMPLLGYLGYLPFGLELYPLTHLLLPRPPAVRV
jgi:hypothetical protein